MSFTHISIIGLGLIGGSIAKAIKARTPEVVISGFDSDEMMLKEIHASGIIDSCLPSVQSALNEAQLVIIATPLAALPTTFQNLQGMTKETLLTDVVSVKTELIELAKNTFGKFPETFVPGHPIAGKEFSGFNNACADLFVNHPVILTPDDATCQTALEAIAEFWQSLGAIVTEMSAEHHDEVLAGTSHVPHVLSYALMKLLSESPFENEIFQYAAGGLRDFSRIAASNPELWADICLNNKKTIAQYLKDYQTITEDLRLAIATNNKKQLLEIFSQGKAARNHFETILNKR